MLIKVKSCSDKNAWYNDCIGMTFNFFEIEEFYDVYFISFELAILKSDVILINKGDYEKKYETN